MPLADIVKRCVAASGLSVNEFARQLGIRPASLYHWTRVPPERVQRVHELTKLPLAQLVPGPTQDANDTAAAS